MTYAFIDTNILMHFKVFDGIDWYSFLSDRDYCLMVCPTVSDDIDKHKDSNKSKARNRAKKVFKILSDHIDGKKFGNVNLEFFSNPPSETSSSDYNGARET